MSIAVSAVIVPSRILRRAQLGFGAANLGAGLALASGLAQPFWQPWAGAVACLLAGAAILPWRAHRPKMRRIDISGLGQLRLTVQLDIGSDDAPVALVQILPGSTLWAGLMLLRLRGPGALGGALALLPDSVEPGQFRRLSVAIRDVASRKL